MQCDKLSEQENVGSYPGFPVLKKKDLIKILCFVRCISMKYIMNKSLSSKTLPSIDVVATSITDTGGIFWFHPHSWCLQFLP